MTVPEKPALTPAERRARREARRAAQRAANVGRAAKMHEARLAWERSPELRHTGDEGTMGPCQIGCSGWYYWHWQGGFYPAELPRVAWFRFYSEQFDTVELNAPFYSWPTVATVRGWLKQAEGSGIIYTESVRADYAPEALHRDEDAGARLRAYRRPAGRSDGLLSFSVTPELSLYRTAAPADRGATRSDSPERRRVPARELVEREGLHRISRTRDHFLLLQRAAFARRTGENADEIYLRFHGPKRWYRHDYSPDELAAWARRISGSGASRVWAYFNNDRDCYAIKNARELRRQLGG